MFADTAAIGAAGVDLTRTATELDAIAAALPAAAGPCAAVLGWVGADFLAALGSALDEAAHEVATLSADLVLAGHTAGQTAVSYAAAERRSVVALGG